MAVVLIGGCRAQGQSDMAPPPPEVDVAEVAAGPIILRESFTGRVAAAETVELRPRVSGYIEEVAFVEGALVEAGDLLFQIDPRPYQARVQTARGELAQAQSQLELATSEVRRAQSLLNSRAISREEYEQRQAAVVNAQGRVDAARATLDSAELDLEYTRVIAPISGRAGRAQITKGNLANADQTLLTTLVSVDPVHVYFEADERSASASESLALDGEHRALHIQLGGDRGPEYIARLDFIDNQLNASTGTLQYRAVLANPGGRIKPGQFARVSMPIARLDQALLVNRKAVLTDQDRRFVYVVDEHNRVDRRQVVTGGQVNDSLLIEHGLNSGDRVIVNGVQKIFEVGMEVSPQQVAVNSSRPDAAFARTGMIMKKL